jgi:hypothetical protein
MDVFAISVIIFLLLCVIALIISIVFFPGTPRTTTTVTTVKNVPVSTPGNDLDDDDDYPLSSGSNRRNWRNWRSNNWNSNINTSTNLTFLNELYAELARAREFATIIGSDSNVYVNSWLSGASGASTGSGSNAYWNTGNNAMINPNGSYANFTHDRWAQMGFSDYDMAAYSPY